MTYSRRCSYQIILAIPFVLGITFTAGQSPVCEVDTLLHEDGSRTATTLTFNWVVLDGGEGGISNCESVELCIDDVPETCLDHTGTVAGTSVFRDLIPGSQYIASLLLRDTASPNNYSDVAVQHGKTLPAAPTNVTSVPGVPPEGALTISWIIPDGVYDEIRVICLGPPGPRENNFTVGVNVDTADCVGLLAGTEYMINISTLHTGQAPVSAPVFIASTDILLPPSNVAVSEGREPTVSLYVSWTPPPKAYHGIYIDMIAYSGGLSRTWVPNTRNDTNIYLLTPGELYSVTLVTNMDKAPSTSDPTDPVHGATVPEKPYLHLFEQLTNNLIFDIRPDGKCSEFRVYCRGLNTGSPLNISTTQPCEEDTYTRWEISGLESNAEYLVEAQTVSNTGPGLIWTVGQKTTIQTWTAPSELPPPMILDTGADWITISWTNHTPHPHHISAYFLESRHLSYGGCYLNFGPMDRDPSPDCTCTDGFVSNPFNYTYLEPADYELTITAVNPGACGAASSKTSITIRAVSKGGWIAIFVVCPVVVILIIIVTVVACRHQKRKSGLDSTHVEPRVTSTNVVPRVTSTNVEPRVTYTNVEPRVALEVDRVPATNPSAPSAPPEFPREIYAPSGSNHSNIAGPSPSANHVTTDIIKQDLNADIKNAWADLPDAPPPAYDSLY